MITAMWWDMNSLIDASGPAGLLAAEEEEEHRTGDHERADHDEDRDRDHASPPESPASAIDAAATAVRARFLGLAPETAAPSTRDLPAVNESIVAVHSASPGFALLGSALPLLGRHDEEQHADGHLDQLTRSRPRCRIVGTAGDEQGDHGHDDEPDEPIRRRTPGRWSGPWECPTTG